MPNPKDVFDDPLQHLDFLQSADFERQQFDWKEVRTDTNSQIDTLKENIKKCISAFANSSREGGLLILGITDDGTIKGTQHVDEQTMNNILQVRRNLINHSTITRDVDLLDSAGNRLHLLYTPWEENAICETTGNFPKGWRRDGSQNFPLTDQDREQLKREKRIVNFEMTYCCPYDPDELDKEMVEEFKKAYLQAREPQYDYTTEEVLFHAGALTKDNDRYAFTNAGFLFFASNPRRRFASAYVRVLRFEVDVEEAQERGVTTFDRDFDGALPKIIRKLRTFFKDSALFRTIIRRSSNRGFIEESEYPLLAVDEALINAAIHRDYGATTSIHCIAYRNGLVVENPGSIPQAVPQHFSLADTTLDSVSRNPTIVEWMRLMKDERGEPLVRSLREGTRKMLQEMEKMRLPAPYYQTSFLNTSVTLYNRIEERLEPHAYADTKETRDNTPSTPSGQDNMGKMSNFIEEHPSKTVDHVNKTSTGLSDLPDGWEWTTLQEVCSTPQYGWTTKATTHGTLHLLRTTDITAGNVNWETVPFCQAEPPDKEKYLLKTGDIVISRAGSVGYSYLVKNPQKAVFASYLIRFKPSPIINEDYLIFFLKSPDYWKTISTEKAGIALQNVNATKLKRIEIPIPPLAEQGRIVAKLEKLFTQLDTGIDNLQKAQSQLQRYRQSLLKAAFEGELTMKWRKGYSGELEPISVSEVSTLDSLPELPDGWMWTTLEEISEIILGQSPPSSTYNTDGEGLPFYQGKLEFGKLYPTPRKWCTAPKKIAQKGDVFISIRAPVGPTNLCPEKSAVGRGLAAIRGLNGIQSFFMLYLMRRFENEIASRGTGTTFKAITANQLKTFQIPLPPLLEQEQIVSELERSLSVADEIEATLDAELKRAKRLRQSILKRAFSGKLVLQDPNDEHASVLMEKIRDEREGQQPKPKKTIKKTKTNTNDTLPIFTLANLEESRGEDEK